MFSEMETIFSMGFFFLFAIFSIESLTSKSNSGVARIVREVLRGYLEEVNLDGVSLRAFFVSFFSPLVVRSVSLALSARVDMRVPREVQ